MRCYYVYILASRSRVLYIGVTNDLERRSAEHKRREVPGFTRDYFVDRLVYFEETEDVTAAIEREKQLKGWRRSKKIALIAGANPTWKDISRSWDRRERNIALGKAAPATSGGDASTASRALDSAPRAARRSARDDSAAGSTPGRVLGDR